MKKKTFDFKWIMLVVLSLMCFQQAEAYDVQTGGLYFNVTEYSDGRAVASAMLSYLIRLLLTVSGSLSLESATRLLRAVPASRGS